jgi:integrase
MGRPKYASIFADEINAYLDYKISSGFKEISYCWNLNTFDKFCVKQMINAPIFTREFADEWLKRRNSEMSTTYYSRINVIKNFLIYLRKKGFDVTIIRDISFRNTQFQPHIYNEDEIRKYFIAVDAFNSNKHKKSQIQLPVIFRLLYCCGTRINETLGIRKQDVDLDEGIIRLFETKNDCERYIVLGDDLLKLMRQFASKCFYLLNDDDYIFTSSNGKRLGGDAIYDHHRVFLRQAGIPFIGDGKGPRIHDWRHTFSVYSFKQMLDAGIDMYVALPILSTYLGHKSIYATEQYVRLTMSMFPYIENKFKDKLDQVFAGVDYEEH